MAAKKKKAAKKKATRTPPGNKMVGGPGKAGGAVRKVEDFDIPPTTSRTESSNGTVVTGGPWEEADKLIADKAPETLDPEADEAEGLIDLMRSVAEEVVGEFLGGWGPAYIQCNICEAYRGGYCRLHPAPQSARAPDEGCCDGLPKRGA